MNRVEMSQTLVKHRSTNRNYQSGAETDLNAVGYQSDFPPFARRPAKPPGLSAQTTPRRGQPGYPKSGSDGG